MSVGSAPLPGNIVPMSAGILSLPVDIHPLSVNNDRLSGGTDPAQTDNDSMSIDIAPPQPDRSRCPSTSVQRPPASNRCRPASLGCRRREVMASRHRPVLSRLELVSAGRDSWPASPQDNGLASHLIQRRRLESERLPPVTSTPTSPPTPPTRTTWRSTRGWPSTGCWRGSERPAPKGRQHTAWGVSPRKRFHPNPF